MVDIERLKTELDTRNRELGQLKEVVIARDMALLQIQKQRQV